MAKCSYIGVDGVARKINKLFIGVDGVARKIKKMYIGVSGVARLFYSNEKISDKIMRLSTGKNHIASATVKDKYVIFSGDINTSNIDAFDANLTRVNAISIQDKKLEGRAGTESSDYAFFAGGRYIDKSTSSGYQYSLEADYYDDKLVNKNLYQLVSAAVNHFAISNESALYIFGGYNGKYGISAFTYYTYPYLTRRNGSIDEEWYHIAGAKTGKYALIGFGYPENHGEIYAFDKYSNRTQILSTEKYFVCGLSFKDYAFFAGGELTKSSETFAGTAIPTTTNCLSSVEVYNNTLTKIAVSPLFKGYKKLIGSCTNKYAMFVEGMDNDDNPNPYSELYDEDLTKTIGNTLRFHKIKTDGDLPWSKGVSFNGKALFAGDKRVNNESDIIDVFEDQN